MTQFASDSFTGSAGTELSAYSASWSKVNGIVGDAWISSAGRVYPYDGAYFKAYRHTAAAPSADYKVSADAVVLDKTAGTGVGLIARASASADTKYLLRVYTADSLVRLFKSVSGASTQLASVSRTFSGGTTYPIRLEVEGSALRAYINNEATPVVSATDASIPAAGSAGIFLSLSAATETSGAHLDNFSAETLGAGGSTQDLAGSGAATASGTATPSAQVAIAGVGVSLAGGTAQTAAAIALSAIGLTVASGTGALSSSASGSLAASGAATAGGSAATVANVTISASGLAQAAAQAGVSAAVLLSGAGAAAAAGNAALAVQLQALAQGAAQASGSATVSGSAAGELSGYGQASASGAALLTLDVRLAAAGSGAASGSGTLSAGDAATLAASGGAAASGSGAVAASVTLTAAGFVQAMGAGMLHVQIPLSAAGGAIAAGVAALSELPDVLPRVASPFRTWRVRAHNRTLRIRA